MTQVNNLKPRKTRHRDWSEHYFGTVFEPPREDSKPWYGNNHVNLSASVVRTWTIPTFSSITDPPLMALGFINGAVGVFPSDSMATYCRLNTTLLYPTFLAVATNATSFDKLEKAFINGQLILRYFHSAIYNCYYTVADFRMAAMYFKPLSFTLVLWNILFNLGFFYTDLKSIFFFFYREEAATTTWAYMTQKVGDFLLRFFFSKYVSTSAYTF